MGFWGKFSWGSHWSFKGNGVCRPVDRSDNKKKYWVRNDDDDCGFGGWKAKKTWKRWDRDDDDDHGWKGWKAKKAWKRWDRDEDDNEGGRFWKGKGWKRRERDEDDRDDSDVKKIIWEKVICRPDTEVPEEQDNRAPEITSPSPAIVTFSKGEPGTEVATILANDADGDTLVFSIVDATDSETADGDFFQIDPDTGVLSFVQLAAEDGSRDRDSVYEVGVQVSDGELTDTILLDVVYLTGA